jgi:deoxyribose-phosphate aldolase
MGRRVWKRRRKFAPLHLQSSKQRRIWAPSARRSKGIVSLELNDCSINPAVNAAGRLENADYGMKRTAPLPSGAFMPKKLNPIEICAASTLQIPGMKLHRDELAKMIDHALLQPTLTDAGLRDGCALAIRYGVASVCVKPYAVELAASILRGSGVAVGTVIGFPHGGNTTENKRRETEQACVEGAAEIDFVVNIGKVLSEDWSYVEEDIFAVCREAHGHGALAKVIFETTYLPVDALKIQLCQIAESANAEFVKTSTGFDFMKGADGRFQTVGATAHDLRLMRAACSEKVRVKASGGVRDLDGLLTVRALGAARCGTSATAQILDEVRRRENTDADEITAPGTADDRTSSGY